MARAMIGEDQVQREVERAVIAYFHVMDLAQGYRGHFPRDSSGAPLLDPTTGKPARVDEGTNQSRGLPDLYLLPCEGYCYNAAGVLLGGCWLEIKRPRIVIGGQVVQDRGYRRWEQEQFHALARAAGDRIATVESASMALSYLLYCGYPIAAENVEPWNELSQYEYFSQAAKPHQRRRATRKVPRRVPWGIRI